MALMNHTDVTPDHRGAMMQYLGAAMAGASVGRELADQAASVEDKDERNRLHSRRGKILEDSRFALKAAEVRAAAANADAILDLVDVMREVRDLLAEPPLVRAINVEVSPSADPDTVADAVMLAGLRRERHGTPGRLS